MFLYKHLNNISINKCISNFNFLYVWLCKLKLPLCGAENVSLVVSVELLGFTSS